MKAKPERFQLPDGSPIARLFAGWFRESYSLPGEIVAAGRAVNVITAATAELRQRRDEVRRVTEKVTLAKTLDDAIAHVVTTGAFPDDLVGPIVQARQDAELATLRYDVADALLPRAESHLSSMVGMRQTFVIGQLHDALEDTLDDVRAIVPALGKINLQQSADDLAAADDDAQRAYMVLVRCRARADDILKGAEVTYRAARSGGVAPAVAFLDCADDPANRGLLSVNAYRAAGPAHPLERLVWLASPAALPWVPTLEQHDERVAEWRRLMEIESRRTPAAVPVVGRAW